MSQQKFIKTKIDLNDLPDHDPDRFLTYFEIKINNLPGFQLETGEKFIFDEEGGWCEWFNDIGCYYNAQGQPDGWIVNDDKGIEHYYDEFGQYVPTDEENLDELPQHQQGPFKFIGNKIKLGNQEFDLDSEGGFEDDQGCYYNSKGEPDGWSIKKADGKIYHFKMDGTFGERNYDDDEDNDLREFETDDIVYFNKKERQNIKQKLIKKQQQKQEQQEERKDQRQQQQQGGQKEEKKQQLPLKEEKKQQPPLKDEKKQQNNYQPQKKGEVYTYKFTLVNASEKPAEDAQLLMNFLKRLNENEGKNFDFMFLNHLTVKTPTIATSFQNLPEVFYYHEQKQAKFKD